MMALYALATEAAANSLLDNSVVTFVVNGIKDVITLCVDSNLAIFITLGIVGSIVGLAMGLVSRVKNL